jgi:ribonucleoside-diphosphate reductase alpha chain
LEKLGYDKNKIEGIKEYVDKNNHVEGCDLLDKEHLSIFDCATVSGQGTRAIEPLGHIRMLGAIQPHLSGAISKTVNCPSTTSVEEIESMFYQAWKLGVKAVAIYRDGCKAAQPLSTKKEGKLVNIARGEVEHLPNLRPGITEKAKIAGISYFIRTGEYEDGRIGEIFLDSLQRGTDVNRLINLNAIQFSEKLQYGIPLKEAIEVFEKAGQSQIAGLTNHPFIRMVSSQEEFFKKWVSAHYLGDISFVPKEPEMRPLPWELRVYQKVPKLHLLPTVEGEKMYPGVPSLEETIKEISGTNYWCDSENGLDTRETIEKIKNTRTWGKENINLGGISGKLTGKTCPICGTMMVSDGSCSKCPHCKTSTGGCGGG